MSTGVGSDKDETRPPLDREAAAPESAPSETGSAGKRAETPPADSKSTTRGNAVVWTAWPDGRVRVLLNPR